MKTDKGDRAIALGIAFCAVMILIALSGCANHCRIDQRVPEGATFEDAERLSREQCK